MDSQKRKPTTFELARHFAATTSAHGSPTIWYWRGGWYIWHGTHYRHTPREPVEKKILSFVETRLHTTASCSVLRSTLDLLRIIQYCDAQTAPCWIDGRTVPNPATLFMVKNGMLLLPRTAAGNPQLLPHDPRCFSLSSADYDYSQSAHCPQWQAFLGELWPDDHRSRNLLREWCGYCLLPDTSHQKILAITGPPRSGKSTIARVLRDLVGPRNVACPSIRSLSGQFGLWAMLDKSVAIIPDATLPRPCPAVEEILKSVSGEDAVDIDRKGMTPLTGVKLPTRIVVLANEMPKFHDPSRALEHRLLTLRTTRSYYGKEDKSLTAKLLEELPGILNWAIEGWKRLQARGHFDERAETATDLTTLSQHFPAQDRIRRIVVEYGCDERPWRSRHKDRNRQCRRHPK